LLDNEEFEEEEAGVADFMLAVALLYRSPL
jgi:hypothetical protein